MPYKDYNDPRRKASEARYYEKNKAAVMEKSKAARKAVAEEVRYLKEASPCSDCGRFYPYWVMQFDHIGSDKVDNISGLYAKGRKATMAEIEKCELVCANCHADRTHYRGVAQLADAEPSSSSK